MTDEAHPEIPDLGYKKVLRVSDLSGTEKTVSLSFPPETFEPLSARLQTEAVKAVSAQISLYRKNRMVFVKGTAEAELVRICVASLEPMTEQVKDDFEIEFELVDEMPELDEEMEMDLDAPEPLADDVLDLAEIAVQQVSLAMDPFPRNPDAEPVRDTGEQPSLSPFAALKDLKED